MMDEIRLEDLKFFAYHGYEEKEKESGQQFFITLILWTDLTEGGKTDKLSDTLNYVDVYEKLRVIMEEERYDLLEALAYRILSEMLGSFSIAKAEVWVSKPKPPIISQQKAFTIRMRRSREEITGFKAL